MANVDIKVGYKTAAFFTANPTLVLKEGQLMFVSDGSDKGKYKIGDGTTQLSALTYYGGVSSTGLTVGTTTITSGTNTKVLYNNNGVVGEYTVNGTGNVVLSSELGNYLTTAAAALAYQPLDSDLTSWAGVTRAAGFDTFVATPSSANLRALLSDENGTGAALFNGATSPDFTTSITIGSVAVPTISSTNTFTNKRITPRITTITSSATPTINTDNCDVVTITALATAITSMTTNLSGTPNNFDTLVIRIKDDGTARAITWGASFEAKGTALPTTTVISKVLTVGFIYDSVTSKWGCIGSQQEA